MRYLIDGHNLIAKIPDISLEDSNDEIELILRLKSWAAASPKRKVTVYFDGGLPGGVAHRLSSNNIKVIFAPQGKTADSLIIQYIGRVNNPPEYTLITSDQQIINAAEKRKMPHWRSEKFARQLGSGKRKKTASSPSTDADDPHISPDEVAQWLEIFGSEPPTPRPDRRTPRVRPKPKPSRRRSPQELKTTARDLNEDEIAEWRDLFDLDQGT